MLRHYAIARQIGDDRTDWSDDLQRERLNYVAAHIMRHMKDTGAIQSYAELDVERMAGYFLYDDALFAGIQRTILEHCRRAGQSIAPYNPLYLGALVDELTERIESGYEAALSARHRLQNLFSLPQAPP
jgi:tRNA G26 N,N-dimethylase Trm1